MAMALDNRKQVVMVVDLVDTVEDNCKGIAMAQKDILMVVHTVPIMGLLLVAVTLTMAPITMGMEEGR